MPLSADEVAKFWHSFRTFRDLALVALMLLNGRAVTEEGAGFPLDEEGNPDPLSIPGPNRVHFQLAVGLQLLADAVQPGGAGQNGGLLHATLATARLSFLFLAAKIVRPDGAVLVRYSHEGWDG